MKGALREFLRAASLLGFEFVGYGGNGHVRLHNSETGDTYTTAATPSCISSWRNCLSDMERMSGRKLPRKKAGKLRYRLPTAGDDPIRPRMGLTENQIEQRRIEKARRDRAVAQSIAAADRHRREIESLMKPGWGR